MTVSLRFSAAQWGLITGQFLMWAGFFVLIPLITVHFVKDLQWAAATIGLLLGIRQISQQGLTIFIGPVADKIGFKPLILTGCLVRAVGFLIIGWAATFPVLLLGILLAGLGGGLFDSPKSAAMASVTAAPDCSRAFTFMNMAGSLGMVIGPLLGSLLNESGFQTAAFMASFLYCLVALIIALTFPARYLYQFETEQQALSGLKEAAKDKQLRRFTFVLIGYYMMSTQLYVLVALQFIELASKKSLGMMYSLHALLAVILQYSLFKFLEKRVSPRIHLMLAALTVGSALGLMAFASSPAWLLVCVALHSIGHMTVFPTQQTLIARFAPPTRLGSYYGFSSISLGVGGTLGNSFGGTLMTWGKQIGFEDLPWLVLFSIGLLTAGGVHWALSRKQS